MMTFTCMCLFFSAYPDPPDKVEVIDKLSTPTMVVMNVTAPSEDGGQPLLGYEVTWETMSQTFDLGGFSYFMMVMIMLY